MTFDELKRKVIFLSNDEASMVPGGTAQTVNGDHPWDIDQPSSEHPWAEDPLWPSPDNNSTPY